MQVNSATARLFGEDVARTSAKSLLRNVHREADTELQNLRQQKINGQLIDYYSYIYRVLRAHYPHFHIYPKPNRRVLFYCLKNFPQKGFIVDPNLRPWYSAKLKLSRFKRFRRGRYSRRYRRRRFFRRSFRRTYRRFYRRYRRRYTRRRRYYRRRY